MNTFWACVVLTSSGFISLALSYHAFVKWSISREYHKDIKEAIEKAIDKKIATMSIERLKEGDS